MFASHDASSNSRPKAAPRPPGWRSPTKAAAVAKKPKPPRTAKRSVREFPALEDAFATGAVSADHLDVLARLTRNLSDVERSDLHAVADEIIDSATTDYVSEFERKTRNIIDDIRNTHAPRRRSRRTRPATRRVVDQVVGRQDLRDAQDADRLRPDPRRRRTRCDRRPTRPPQATPRAHQDTVRVTPRRRPRQRRLHRSARPATTTKSPC